MYHTFRTRSLFITALCMLLGLSLTTWAGGRDHRHRPAPLPPAAEVLIDLGLGTAVRALAPDSLTAGGILNEVGGAQVGVVLYPTRTRVESTEGNAALVNGAYDTRVAGVAQFGAFTNAFTYGPEIGLVNLGTLGSPRLFSAVNAFNARHYVGFGDNVAQSAIVPLWWPSGGHAVALPTLGGMNGHASSINDFDAIAGDAQTTAGYSHCTVWSPDGSVIDCHDDALGSISFGAWITNDGTVYGNISTPHNWRGFRWSRDEGMVLLEPLEGDTYTVVRQANDAGLAAGRSCLPQLHEDVCRATVWDVDGTPRDLNDGHEGSGWVLETAWVNNLGVYVGTGIFHGEEHSWALIPLPARGTHPLPPPMALRPYARHSASQ